MKFAAGKGIMVFGMALLMLVSALFALGQNVEASKHKWMLTAIDGKTVSDSKAYIEIDNANGRFIGHTGCNRMFGGITSNEKLKFGAVGMTRMACAEDEVNNVESGFMTELAKITAIKENGSTLEMLDGSRVALTFKSSFAGSATKLEDKKWVLESIKGVDLGLSKELPFVNFDAKANSLGGNTGCNVFGGSMQLTGSKFDASKMISTMRACMEDDKMSIERQLLDSLDKTDNFEIKDGKLFMFEGRELLLTFRGESK